MGDARLALAALRHEIHLPSEELKQVEQYMHQPTPRIALGLQLRGIATAALDVSDGLLNALRHIMSQSQLDAEIQLDQLPQSTTLQKQEMSIQNQFAACGGADYEICFTTLVNHRDQVAEIGNSLNPPLTLIGKTLPRRGIEAKIDLLNSSEELLSDAEAATFLNSFDHFAS
ncbi:thiamine-phosphate kinase [Polynucleobacter necessarius]|uniref:thiamine-phosphate kinase n=1 Tax=Polynucleobacter necessarius TaxID=576610 RepID=UPI001E3F726D|nr:AIR synthase-related protein [Polynucleobacter necessarius]